MDAPSTSRRLPVVLLALVVVSTAACGTLAGDAATVGDVAISDDELRDELAEAAEFAEVNPGTEAEIFARSGPASFSMESTSFLLTTLIQTEAFDQILATLGGEITDEDRASTESIRTAFTDNGWLDGFIESQTLQVAVTREISEELEPSVGSAEEWFAVNRGQFADVVCARHILVATEDEAAAVYARIIDDGEAFEDVAAELGTDATAANGGDLGCQSPSAYVPEFAVAIGLLQPGEVSEPFSTDFGWHVARVDASGDDLDYEDLADQVDPAYQAAVDAEVGEQLNDRLRALLDDIDVSVSSRYGIWNGNSVVGPDAAG